MTATAKTTETTAQDPLTSPHAGATGRMWFAVGTGFIAWSLHLLLSYWAVSVACDTHMGAIDLVLHLLTLLALAATLAAAFYGWQVWRAGPGEDGDGEVVDSARRGAFMGLFGIGLSTLFLIAIIYGEVTTLFLPPCG